jgi:hypothetical protein
VEKALGMSQNKIQTHLEAMADVENLGGGILVYDNRMSLLSWL